MIFVDIELEDEGCRPKYAHEGDSGVDLRACLEGPVTIEPGERKLINTGIKIRLPKGIEAQVRPRSGLALKKGITVLNTPGTVDESYLGKVGVIIINHGIEPVVINPYERIAQLVFCPVERALFNTVERIDDDQQSPNQRGTGGFGSTGVE